MADIEKVIKELESLRDICNAKSNMAIGKGKVAWAGYANTADDAITMLKEQEQLKIALSEGQKQVQSLLSSGRELEETINILKGEIERLKVEKADIMRGIERKIAQANSILK